MSIEREYKKSLEGILNNHEIHTQSKLFRVTFYVEIKNGVLKIRAFLKDKAFAVYEKKEHIEMRVLENTYYGDVLATTKFIENVLKRPHVLLEPFEIDTEYPCADLEECECDEYSPNYTCWMLEEMENDNIEICKQIKYFIELQKEFGKDTNL
jgi:hypothetical protein